MKVIKRDGRIVEWDAQRIVRAVDKACGAAQLETVYGLQVQEDAKYELMLLGRNVTVDEIHDTVEEKLMAYAPSAAKEYILYRAERAKSKEFIPDPNELPRYIHPAKYGRYVDDLKRREVYDETVDRVSDMHIHHFCTTPNIQTIQSSETHKVSTIKAEGFGQFEILDSILYKMDARENPFNYWAAELIFEAIGEVRAKNVLPSMRSMQFAGDAIENHNARMYNCSFTHIDRRRVFGEALYLLLCGCGVGYSVQRRHTERLPPMGLLDRRRVVHFTIPDTIEGWGNSIHALFDAHVNGYWIEFNYCHIRPEGSPLVSSGGKAPGHIPLKLCHKRVGKILSGASGRKLRPIECHDIMCHIAEAVLAGGIRRSSMISLFDYDDEEMMMSKTPGHFEFNGKNKQREMANNSPVLLRNETSRETIEKIIRTAYHNWDPGLYLTSDPDYGTNPCGEIGLYPILSFDQGTDTSKIEAWLKEYGSPEEYNRLVTEWEVSGFAFCNLTEVNATAKDLAKAVRAAAILGTFQAAYTSFPFLGPISEEICKRDALLGVSLTGMCDNPEIFSPIYLKRLADIAVQTNEEVARGLGINKAKRVTCVKPSGTASLELNVSSGIHPHHAKRYFRRVTANPLEAPAQLFAQYNPHAVDVKPNGDLSLVFPVQTDGITLDMMTAIAFLDRVKMVYQHWVQPGGGDYHLTHNVSCTVAMHEHEIEEVITWVWHNLYDITALSFAHRHGEKGIQFLPRQRVDGAADEARWRELISKWKKVPYETPMDGDNVFNLEPGCAGGQCLI